MKILSPEEGETRGDGETADERTEVTDDNGKTTEKATAAEKREAAEEERQRRSRLTEHARTMLSKMGIRDRSDKK